MMKTVKSILVPAVIFVLVVSSASAVEISAAGLKFGLNLASLSKDEASLDLKSKTGFAAGGFVAFNLSKDIAVQAEILYMQKGAKYDFNEQGVVASYDFNFAYIEIPVLIKAYFPLQDSVVRPLFFFGPYVGFKAGAKTKYEITAYGETQSGEEDMVEVKSTDFGGIFGVGADIKLGAGKISLEARYGLSFTAFSSEDGAVSKHRAFSFLLGYSFF